MKKMSTFWDKEMMDIASNEILNKVFKDENPLSKFSTEYLRSVIMNVTKELKRREKMIGCSTEGDGNYNHE